LELEHKILQKLNTLGLTNLQITYKLENFYGIGIDDFTHEIANLSLLLSLIGWWNSMALRLTLNLSPLKDAGNVYAGSTAHATRLGRGLPKNDGDDEVYLIGNLLTLAQACRMPTKAEELAEACKGFANKRNLDYISHLVHMCIQVHYWQK